MEKYLPLGTIIVLQNFEKQIMITGYAQIDMIKKDKIYDYSGVFVPEGIVSNDQNILFNHDQIEQIVYKGYCDEEIIKYNEMLKEMITEDNVKQILTSVKE